MKILLTNDDGVYADGITELAVALKNRGHQIAVAAPDRERSASGHAITIKDPIRALKIQRSALPETTIYRVSGTPADCVKLAVEKLIDFVPELIISGINHGPNLGLEILYSGTVSAAIEASMLGYPSIAVSMDYSSESAFAEAAEILADLLENNKIFKNDNKFLLNINFPKNIERNSNVKITKLGRTFYCDNFVERRDPMGNTYYWLYGDNRDLKDESSDIAEYLNGNISITPLKIDLTDLDELEFLKKNFE
ncbi:MAG: 5'/3'-nucleotidase SurE [Halanaerobium sp.]